MEQKIKSAANDKFQELRDKIKAEVKAEVRKEIIQEVGTSQASSNKEDQYDRLKDKAFNKRHNILIFGLTENSSQDEDRQAALTFFLRTYEPPKTDH